MVEVCGCQEAAENASATCCSVLPGGNPPDEPPHHCALRQQYEQTF